VPLDHALQAGADLIERGAPADALEPAVGAAAQRGLSSALTTS
jgi:hypothetical protein